MSAVAEPNVVEVLEPSSPDYEVVVGDNVYVQKPLSFFGKIELFSVLAETIEKALSEGITISELLDEIPEDTQNIKANQITETDILVKGLAKIVKYSPDILKDIFCISLGIKKNQREWFKEELETLDDDDAAKIANQFIDQNWDAIWDFFSKQVSPLIQNVSDKMQSRSTSSKPSKGSRQRTQKQ